MDESITAICAALNRIALALENAHSPSISESAFLERAEKRKTWPRLKASNFTNEAFDRHAAVIGREPTPADVEKMVKIRAIDDWTSVEAFAQRRNFNMPLAEAWLFFGEIAGLIVTGPKGVFYFRNDDDFVKPPKKPSKNDDTGVAYV